MVNRKNLHLTIMAYAIVLSSAFVVRPFSVTAPFTPTPTFTTASSAASSTTTSTILYSSIAAEHEHNVLPPQDQQSLLNQDNINNINNKINNDRKKMTPKKSDSNHKNGIFSPVVLAAKKVLGEERLNKIRGNAISLHSDVIGRFVDTSDTEFGQTILRKLFELADVNKNGKIEEEELVVALQTLGFGAFLKEKQLKGIFARADLDENGSIDLEEWLAEAPRTLRTNLVKLAKKNGGDLGFLV